MGCLLASLQSSTKTMGDQLCGSTVGTSRTVLDEGMLKLHFKVDKLTHLYRVIVDTIFVGHVSCSSAYRMWRAWGQGRIGARVMRLDFMYWEWSGNYLHSKWGGACSIEDEGCVTMGDR